MTKELPRHGETIIFNIIPTASYCSVGVWYKVERTGKSFRFVNATTGSATFDPLWAVARSVWLNEAAYRNINDPELISMAF